MHRIAAAEPRLVHSWQDSNRREKKSEHKLQKPFKKIIYAVDEQEKSSTFKGMFGRIQAELGMNEFEGGEK